MSYVCAWGGRCVSYSMRRTIELGRGTDSTARALGKSAVTRRASYRLPIARFGLFEQRPIKVLVLGNNDILCIPFSIRQCCISRSPGALRRPFQGLLHRLRELKAITRIDHISRTVGEDLTWAIGSC